MNSKELMVGDWVYCEGQPTPDNVTIETIAEDGVWFNGPIYEGAASYDRIFPIPLTPEILEKNGFRIAKADRMCPADRYFWGVEGTRDGAIVEITFYNPDVHGVKVLTKIHTQSSHESGINSMHSCDIESVHELQHALRLCKIDKNIVL